MHNAKTKRQIHKKNYAKLLLWATSCSRRAAFISGKAVFEARLAREAQAG